MFRGRETLEFKLEEWAANVPGHFTVERGRPHFIMDLGRQWQTMEGAPMYREVLRLADVIRREAPANRVVIEALGRPDDSADLA